MRKVIFDVVGALIEERGKILVCQRFDNDFFWFAMGVSRIKYFKL